MVEEFGALRCIIDDLRDLADALRFINTWWREGREHTLCWSTVSWPAFVREGPRRWYLRVSREMEISVDRTGALFCSSFTLLVGSMIVDVHKFGLCLIIRHCT